MWTYSSPPPHSWQYDFQKMATWGVWREQCHFCAWAKAQTFQVWVLREKSSSVTLGTGRVRRPQGCEVLWKESKRASEQTGPPWCSITPACPLACEADFKAVNTEKSTHYLTFVSMIGHLVKRASDEGQIVHPQMEEEECACPAKLGLSLVARLRALFPAYLQSLLVCLQWAVEIGKHGCCLHWQQGLSSRGRLSLDGTGW